MRGNCAGMGADMGAASSPNRCFAAIVVGLWVGVFRVLAFVMDSIIDRKATKSDQSPTD